MGQAFVRIEWDMCTRLKVALVIHQGNVTGSPQYHVMVGVVPGVPDGHIVEHTTVRTKYIVRPGPHLLANM